MANIGQAWRIGQAQSALPPAICGRRFCDFSVGWLPLFAAGVAVANEIVPLVHARRNGHIEKSDHHFLGCLVAPGYGFFQVGIVGIIFRIDLFFGLGKLVIGIPEEVVPSATGPLLWATRLRR
jgi:hypothetical protein